MPTSLPQGIFDRSGSPISPVIRAWWPPVALVLIRCVAASVITPPVVTETVLDDAIAAGIEKIWLQPGAESPAAIERAREAGIEVISGGPCILVSLGKERSGEKR